MCPSGKPDLTFKMALQLSQAAEVAEQNAKELVGACAANTQQDLLAC